MFDDELTKCSCCGGTMETKLADNGTWEAWCELCSEDETIVAVGDTEGEALELWWSTLWDAHDAQAARERELYEAQGYLCWVASKAWPRLVR